MKKGYKNIILALEFNPKADKSLIETAQYMAEKTNAKITLVHVVEGPGSYGSAAYGVINIVNEIEKDLLKHAAVAMEKMAAKLNIPKKNQVLMIGSAKFVILEAAEKVNADLIVVGSHGREGVRALIGSTANAVLHGAKCDVLAVRIS